MLTVDGRHVGTVPPFTVDSPWWNDVEPVTAHLDAVLGVPTSVLRLVSATGSGMRDGTVTYQVELAAAPDRLSTPDPSTGARHDFPDTPLRMPWARPGGPAALVAWAERSVTRTGPAVQVKTWNLSCLYRLPTDSGHVWAKEFPSFMADEAEVIALVAAVDPALVPQVLAAEPRRLLMAESPGADCWHPAPEVITDIVPRWVAVQAALAGPARLRVRGVDVPAFGLPHTLLHGDFHPGNWRSGGTVLDWGDAHWGHPALDAARLIDFAPAETRPLIERTWAEAWRRHRPDSDPERALDHARSAVHLVGALVYQEFLDNIEESERVYHAGDPERELALAQSRAVRTSSR
ncbi:phosphotransferase family enzyme [Saccharothrix australiensis]|uniref:Phosphotransferase family enzyme n=1 Tax=Saccharothrix australiensis TaxID=2072 RepID=A0A495W6D2_9PSEU|nr:phosphotransferase family enzyme [Saccharothrix australiensis]